MRKPFAHSFIHTILVLALAALMITSGCGREGKDEEGTRVLCSFLPVWILTKNVIGDIEGVDVDILLPPGGSPHGFIMRPEDKKKIANADIMIINGHDLQFETALAESIADENPDVVIIAASERVTPRYFDHNSGRHREHEADAPHEKRIRDPHTWVSPKQAIVIVETIRDELMKTDPGHADEYGANADAYIEELRKLVAEYDEAARSFENKKIVTGHHAFGYLARDFGIEIVAVIEEIPQQEPSAGELQELADKIKASGAAAIFAEPQVRSNLVRTIAEATGLPVRILDPLGTGKMRPEEYIRIMRKNLDELKRALM